MTDEEEYSSEPQPTEQPRMIPLQKPTLNALILDRMDDMRVETINLDQSIEGNTAVLMALRTEIAVQRESDIWRNRVYLGLAIGSLALLVILLMAVMFLFGAMR